MVWAWCLPKRNYLLAKQDYVASQCWLSILSKLKVSLRQTTQLMIHCTRQNWGPLQNDPQLKTYIMTSFIFTGLQTLLYGLSMLDS